MPSEQLTKGQENVLEKQGYRIVGNHSAVKTCQWTRNMLSRKGECYKYKFYGIRSHQCLQMTTSFFCASRCKFCWRGLKAPVSDKWYGSIDAPDEIASDSIKTHVKLLQGFKGSDKADKTLVKEMENVRHVALSLTGEPIAYPKINELLKEFHKRRISTFLVTNAQYPEKIKEIENATQLYLSIDAPNKALLKKIDNPLFDDFWERMNNSLDLLKTRNYRTCIRLTMIKNENMCNAGEYAKLMQKGMPDFVELKSYMWIGGGRANYKLSNMPSMKEVQEFSKELLKFLPDYEYIAEHIPSRAVLIAKKSLNKKTFIDFNKFFELINSGKEFKAEDYSSEKMIEN